MATVGMEIRGPVLRQRLLDAGLPADPGGRVLFPRDVVERAIATAPSSFVLYDRDGKPHADLGGDRVHFVPGSSGLRVIDHRTGEARLANSTDFVEYVRLADGLRNIAYLATAFSTNADIEAQVSDAWRLYMCLTNSKRPVVSGAFTEHGVPRMVEMLQLFRRDRADLVERPMTIFTITATGNFRYSEDSCQNLIDCVEAGIPVEIVPVTLMGLIAPVTLVGAIDLPHRRRPDRDRHGPARPAGCAGPVRRGAGDVPHEDRQLADGGDRGAPPRRRLRRGRQAARPADPVVHGALGRQGPRRPGGRRDVRERAPRRARRGQLGERPGDARLRPRLQPGQARVRRRGVRPGAPLRARDRAARRPADDRPRPPADERPAPDHGRAHARALARRAVPALDGLRPRQPRELDEGRGPRRRPAGDARGRPAPRRLPADRDRPGGSTASSGPIIRAGLHEQTELPTLPPATEPTIVDDPAAGRRRNPRREPRRPTTRQEDPPS